MSQSKTQKVQVQISVQVPTGTSKTKVEKTLSTLLKTGQTYNTDESLDSFRLGAPKVVATA